MLARRRLAAAALVLPLLTGVAACSDDADEQVPGDVEDVAPGTREEGVPEEPLQEGTPEVEVPVVPSEG